MAAETEREERIVHNELVFRSANQSLHGSFADAGLTEVELFPFLCECGDRACTRVLSIPLESYERIRRHPARFLILPGHLRLPSEDLVEEHEGFHVVDKRGRGGELARADWAASAER